jgi:hypothetical protein
VWNLKHKKKKSGRRKDVSGKGRGKGRRRVAGYDLCRLLRMHGNITVNPINLYN